MDVHLIQAGAVGRREELLSGMAGQRRDLFQRYLDEVRRFVRLADELGVTLLLGTDEAHAAIYAYLERFFGESEARAMKSLADAALAVKDWSGGTRIGEVGNFWQPTVLTDVPENARIMNEEPFGPLALVNPVRDLDEAISKANALPFGLAAYAFTNSADNVQRLSNEVETGNLTINHFVASTAETPFGGTIVQCLTPTLPPSRTLPL